MTKLDDNRLYWIDAIRSFACLCVLLTHSVIPGGSRGGNIVAPIQYLSVAGASVLFFMISGALVFYKPKPFVPFIKRRLTKIFLPMVIWTIITLIICCLTHGIEWSQLPNAIMLIPFTPQFGTYWFIYCIFGIYLLTPMVATWLEKCSQTDVLILISIGLVAMTIPYFKIIDPDFIRAFDTTGSLYYFIGYLWICLIGYYIRRYINIPKFKWWHILIFLLVIALPFFLVLIGEPYALIQKRTSINVVLLCSCYFIILKHIKYSNFMKKVVYNFAQHSFGIYLVHKQIDNFILAPIVNSLDLSYTISIPFVFISSLIISYAIVHLISKLPHSEYLIAYNS
ncbi:MAG: acyltransferase family protein [Muribaculaceae bacterium]|nr:acyltransferase family protein [Muribaculaceae bacterium]